MKKINVKKYISNKLLIASLIIIILLILMLTSIKKIEYTDTVKYERRTYYLLEYNTDIFAYNFNSNEYYEEDKIHPIKHADWNIVYFNGDLFLPKNEVKKAHKYYADDKNYEWFIVTEEKDIESIVPISLTEKEIKYLYDMDNMDKKDTFTFDDIEQFANLTKISKDKTVFALVSLARHNNSWYWKTEIMSNTEDDQEYIIKLPESLNKKINNALSIK